MDRVDAMKKLQGWTDVTMTYFRDLARFGEQLLLSIRYGNWSDRQTPTHAANWARDWRAEIQSYIHAYRAVTGVDLAAGSRRARKSPIATCSPRCTCAVGWRSSKRSGPRLPRPATARHAADRAGARPDAARRAGSRAAGAGIHGGI